MAPADNQRRITGHVLALNLIFCISEFTKTNGATQLLPGSHTFETLDQPPEALKNARIVEAPQGAVLVFNVNTWHGASKNSSDQTRYALLTPWRRFWTRCEYEIARIVKPEVLTRAGDEGKAIFGLEAQAPYLDHWQWDRSTGAPKAEWTHLKRD
jgi:ectoine hydroxylase-related dioxygenase (phytanoyl-CoA dioxygenase family)